MPEFGVSNFLFSASLILRVMFAKSCWDIVNEVDTPSPAGTSKVLRVAKERSVRAMYYYKEFYKEAEHGSQKYQQLLATASMYAHRLIYLRRLKLIVDNIDRTPGKGEKYGVLVQVLDELRDVLGPGTKDPSVSWADVCGETNHAEDDGMSDGGAAYHTQARVC